MFFLSKHRLFGKPATPYCFAPFGALCFMPGGHVYACFHNRLDELGKYPENSIKSIWTGKKIKQLRKSLINQTLSLGCYGCTPAGVFGTSRKAQYDFLGAKNTHPKHFDFQLSNICNLNCQMCITNSAINVLSLDNENHTPLVYDDAFVAQLEPFFRQLESASFLGGETFLIDIFYKIWAKMAHTNKHIKIYATTNGTIYNERVRQVLSESDFQIMLSIESFKKSVYEGIRRNALFENTMTNIDLFDKYMKDKGGILRLNVCLLNENWEEMPSIFDYSCKKGYGIHIIKTIVPKNNSLLYLSSDTLKDIHQHLKENAKNIFWEGLPQNKNIYDDMLRQIEIWQNEAMVFEKKELFTIEKPDLLVKYFLKDLYNTLKSEMPYLKKKAREEIMAFAAEALNKTRGHLENDRDYVELLKNMQRFPIYEFAVEAFIKKGHVNSLVNTFLMFR